MTNETLCFVFGKMPRCNESFTLAVTAASLKDARGYVNAIHRGGKLIHTPALGSKVNASCGAVTESARKLIAMRNSLLDAEKETGE